MRLFIGIPLAAVTAQDLAVTVDRIRSAAHQSAIAEDERAAISGGLRWSGPESWHITLQFLGRTTDQQYECLTARLRELLCPPVSIDFDSMGFFDRAGVFYSGIQATNELRALQQSVTAATAHCGFVPESRPYHPHVTLARRKGKDGGRGFRALRAKIKSQIDDRPQFSGFVAEAFAIYESIPSPEGSQYTIRERFPLIELGGESTKVPPQ
jgi:2'-5' RNA ligase